MTEEQKAISISELESMNIKQLYEIAKSLGIPRYTSMRKRDLIFAILKAQTESTGYFFGEGVLEIHPEGFGFFEKARGQPSSKQR